MAMCCTLTECIFEFYTLREVNEPCHSFAILKLVEAKRKVGAKNVTEGNRARP